MKIYRSIEDLPLFHNAVITIGTFDGVHEGHQKVIQQLIAVAKSVRGESVIITFHPHPRKIVSSSILGMRLLNSLEEKIMLLEKLEVDRLVIIPFTDVFANQPPEVYLKDFLIEKFHPHTIIIGHDHRFGKNRKGDYKLLEQFHNIYQYQLKEIPRYILENISISSTAIREALLKGNIDKANHLLGYDFFFEGIVVDGDKLGRELGYPTANLKIESEEKIIPADGIYAVYIDVHQTNEKLKGMMSIGFRPTVDGSKRVIEVNIFNFNENIYQKRIRIYVKKFLRNELKFNSLEALVQQIDNDKINSEAIL